jgi:hypothetical protein
VSSRADALSLTATVPPLPSFIPAVLFVQSDSDMSTVSFVSAPATLRGLRVRRAAPSACRAAPLRCAAAPPPPDRDQEWLDMAKEMGAGSNRDPVRLPPSWEFPEGTDFSTPSPPPPDVEPDAILPDPWAVWNSALQKGIRAADEPLPARDPDAETDFWREAAREAVPVTGGSPVDAAKTRPVPGALSENASQREIWGAASEVTASVSDLQERLRSELQNFNPYEETDSYRDIARELVGPVDDDDVETPPTFVRDDVTDDPDFGVSAGSGWNPDVDWMRFDDIARDASLKLEKEQRAEVRDGADQTRRDAVDSVASDDSELFSYTDADGNILSSEEVEEAMAAGAMFVDESGVELGDLADAAAPQSTQFTPSPLADSPPSTPPTQFPRNKPRSSSTYGADSSAAISELKSLQEQGIELRDPEADKNFWREAASSIGIVSPVDPPASSPTPVVSSSESQMSVIAISVDDVSTASLAADREDEIDSTSAWSVWNSGQQAWVGATETAPPRDAKAEVDMWRDAAREVVSGSRGDKGSGNSGAKDAVSATVSGGNTASPWSSWTAANSTWENSLQEADGNLQDTDLWRSAARELVPNSTNGGEPLGKKTWGADFKPVDSFAPETGGWGSGLESTDTSASGWGSGFSTDEVSSGWGSGFSLSKPAVSREWGAGLNSLDVGRGDDASTLLGQPLWSTRADVSSSSSTSRGKPSTPSPDAALWREAAQEMSASNGFESNISAPASLPPTSAKSDSSWKDTNSEPGKGAAVEFWKTLARDIVLPQSESETDDGALH